MKKINRIMRKIWSHKYLLRSIISTIYFNYKYLPFIQAVRLPIILYKPRLKKCTGSVLIDASKISFGMIVLGANVVPLYPNNGILIENSGIIIFKGKCMIGNDSSLCIGKKGKVVFGERFASTCALKIVAFNCIIFGKSNLIGWNNMFLDTDFHRLKCNSYYVDKGYGPIVIGDNNWFANNCTTMKNTSTPNFCVVASNSLLNKSYEFEDKCMIGGTPARLLKKGIWRDCNDDIIDYTVN